MVCYVVSLALKIKIRYHCDIFFLTLRFDITSLFLSENAPNLSLQRCKQASESFIFKLVIVKVCLQRFKINSSALFDKPQ